MPLVATRGAASAQGFGEFAQSAAANYIEDVFSTYLYTGNGSTQTITNGIDLSTKGGLVWCKYRNVAGQSHGLFDTARGASNVIYSNLTNAQNSESGVTAFNTTGFSLGSNSGYNANNGLFVSWTFRKQPKFFDVVTYTGNATSTLTGFQVINHSLGSTPGCIIVKAVTASVGGDWYVWHRTQVGKYANLNTTGAFSTDPRFFNNTSPTSTTFTVGDTVSGGGGYGLPYGYGTNENGVQYVAYLFAHDAGGFGLTGTDNVISCGSYTGTGAAGNAITLGYEPQWVLIKRVDSTGNWNMQDTMRQMSLTNNLVLYSNLSNAEFDLGSPVVYPTATGFTLGTGSAGWNASGGTYIYIAIRRGPMKTPTSGTSVFSPNRWTSATGSTITTNLPVDMQIGRWMGGADGNFVQTRLIGLNTTTTNSAQPYLLTDSTAAESTNSSANYGYNNLGFLVGANNTGNGWGVNFRRAPGFFDVVCYTGTGVNRTVNHNLGVVPELMIVKRRDAIGSWSVYAESVGAEFSAPLDFNSPFTSRPTYWNSTAPTSTSFSLGTSSVTNSSGNTFVWYGFASCPGVSKVGTYTGTGALQTINCGFTGGARFVLIRTVGTGDWFVYDSARGITSGNDPYLLMNSTAAEVTGTNYVDITSVGFQVTAAASTTLNVNGNSYIFLAIA